MAEASGSGERQLPDFGSDNKPNQPPQFDFPKREFGKTKPVKRAFQAQWFMKWKWLHYDCSRDLVFCFTLLKAMNIGSNFLGDSNNFFSISQVVFFIIGLNINMNAF